MISLLQDLIVQWIHFLESGYYFYEISKKAHSAQSKSTLCYIQRERKIAIFGFVQRAE